MIKNTNLYNISNDELSKIRFITDVYVIVQWCKLLVQSFSNKVNILFYLPNYLNKN